jgi:hypothetical protein
MSAWMITNDHADFLATAYVRLVDPAADPQTIAQDLLRENMFSLRARYGTPVDEQLLSEYQFREWPGELDLSSVHKNAACADYQCCEHQEWADSFSAKAMKALCDAAAAAVSAPAYDAAPWGIEAEHRPAPPPPPTFHAERGPGRYRAILVDPVAKSITEGWQDAGLTAWYKTLGCCPITSVPLGRDNAGAEVDMICDDEGRLKADQSCFQIGGHLIAGRALLCSHDDEGETTGTALTLSEVRRIVEWASPATDYSPPEPVVISFSSWDALRASGLI